MNKTLEKLKYDDIDYYSMDTMDLYCKVVKVHNGNICSCIIATTKGFEKHTVRLFGYNLAESFSKMDLDYREKQIKKEIAARNYLASITTNSPIDINKKYTEVELNELVDQNTKILKITCMKNDKNGNLIGILYSEDDAITINERMVNSGNGYVYGTGS